MKSILLCTFFLAFVSLSSIGQATQINSNKSLDPIIPLSADKTILLSGIDSTLWVTNATQAGTFQLSTTIIYGGAQVLLNGKLIFRGRTAAEGTEIFVTDGTVAGTKLLSDIYPGTASSIPDDEMAALNGFAYFTAFRPAEGRELWRTDGTPGNTTFVKDMVSGPTGANEPDSFNLFSNGTYLLLSVRTAASGTELWTSNGTDGGTVPLKEINGGAASSSPDGFYRFDNLVLFYATTAAEGKELWKTNGTLAGTTIVKDINPGTGSSTVSPFGGLDFGFSTFYRFGNRVFFNANSGTTSTQIWFTDGNEAATDVLVSYPPGGPFTLALISNAVAVGNKFFFAYTNGTDRYELWQSTGTPAGTELFRSFMPPSILGFPFIYPTFQYDLNTESYTQPLFQGNKFFFTAGTMDEGVELWVSDGTLPGTKMVKNIGPDEADGVTFGVGAYTTAYFYFTASDEDHGAELWRSDGTEGGTNYVQDIYTGTSSSDPVAWPVVVNGKLLFTANNGDLPTLRDLYVVEGVTPLPLNLLDFTVAANLGDAQLKWSTAQEVNSKDFIIQRSFDGVRFTDISGVAAAGSSAVKRTYGYTDPGMISSGRNVVYYRLNMRDKDGKSTMSKVITLTLQRTKNWNVQLVNNPVIGSVKVLVSGTADKVQFSITDISGKTLYRSLPAKINGQVTLPPNTLKPGVYVLVSETNNERKALRFIKN